MLLFAVIFLAGAPVSAQSSISPTHSTPNPTASPDLSALTPCVLGCTTAAAADSICGNFTNLTCICGNASYQQKSISCIEAECKASDKDPYIAYQEDQCGRASLYVTTATKTATTFLPSNSAADFTKSAHPVSSTNSSTVPRASQTHPTSAGTMAQVSVSASSTHAQRPSSIPVAPMVGGFVGGIAFLFVCITAAVRLFRRRGRRRRTLSEVLGVPRREVGQFRLAPFMMRYASIRWRRTRVPAGPASNLRTNATPVESAIAEQQTSESTTPNIQLNAVPEVSESPEAGGSAPSTNVDELQAQVYELQGQVHALTQRLNTQHRRSDASTRMLSASPPPPYRVAPPSGVGEAEGA